jgi:hypothetical protein
MGIFLGDKPIDADGNLVYFAGTIWFLDLVQCIVSAQRSRCGASDSPSEAAFALGLTTSVCAVCL